MIWWILKEAIKAMMKTVEGGWAMEVVMVNGELLVFREFAISPFREEVEDSKALGKWGLPLLRILLFGMKDTF